MFETRSEVPSEDELREYFDLHLAKTALALLRLSTDKLARIYPGEIVAALSSLGPLGADHLYERATRAVFQSLLRLKRLPRTDPFWHNTNCRPTWFKLREFCIQLLRADPDDELALWTLGALEVAEFQNAFGQVSWARLHDHGRFELPLAVCAAYLASLTAADIDRQLAHFLQDRCSPAAARVLLEPFRLRGAGALPDWVEKMQQQLETSP